MIFALTLKVKIKEPILVIQN